MTPLVIVFAVIAALVLASAAWYYHTETVRRLKDDARNNLRQQNKDFYSRGYVDGREDERNAIDIENERLTDKYEVMTIPV